METKKDFYKFILKRLNGSTNKKDAANCHAYSLFVSGEKDSEKFVSGRTEIDCFDKLKKSNIPKIGYLAIWRDDDSISHSAIVRNINPLVFSNRRETYGEVVNKDTICSLEYFYKKHYHGYNFSDKELEFRIPSKLQKILDAEESK